MKILTKSEKFKLAHKMAKATAKAFSNYMIAFSFALKSLSRAKNSLRDANYLAKTFIKNNSRVLVKLKIEDLTAMQRINAFDSEEYGQTWEDGEFVCAYKYFN